jgi:hypothetical protein
MTCWTAREERHTRSGACLTGNRGWSLEDGSVLENIYIVIADGISCDEGSQRQRCGRS